MSALWYGILAFMFATYLALDGRNFGTGVLHWLVAKTSLERRQVIAAIGPLWTWHEVWLLGVGGVMLMAFPRLMAVAFSGYYLALFLVLWCILLRGISIEVGAHMDDVLWQTFWDVVFTSSSGLLAILFGVALGNLLRGVPLKSDGSFHLTFFTNFSVRGEVGLLDWYTIGVALFFLLVLTAHGATYLTMRTEGPVHDRARKIAIRLWIAVIPALTLMVFVTRLVRAEFLRETLSRPLLWLTVAICGASAVALARGLLRQREKLAVIGATIFVFGLVMSGAASLYPFMFFSTLNPADHLTAAAAAAPERSLKIAAVWWFPALALTLTYQFIIQHYYSGKVNVARDTKSLY
jgi:cytochrome d ubiquinol oxidase subunit II